MNNIMDKIESLDLSFASEAWFIKCLVILGVAIIANLAAHLILKYLKKISDYTVNGWDDALIRAAEKPLSFVIWFLAIISIGDTVNKHKGAFLVDFLAPTAKVGIIICVTWFLMRFINFISHDIVEKSRQKGQEIDFTTVDAISKLVRAIVIIFSALIIMQNLGFSVSGLLAAGGVGGVVLGFAAKDTIANFFGGLSIYMDRPFGVGDWIKSPDRQIEGIVEQIGWRQTRLRALNKNAIYVPNSVFSNIIVENPSRMTNRRIKEVIGIRYEDISKISKITDEIKTMLQNSSDLDHSQPIIVSFTTFSPSSLDFQVNAFTKTTDALEFSEIKQDILLKIAYIIEKNEAEIAFPTTTVISSAPKK